MDVMHGSLGNKLTLSAYLTAILHPLAWIYLLCKRFLIICKKKIILYFREKKVFTALFKKDSKSLAGGQFSRSFAEN